MTNVLIVEARFYSHISDMLLGGATKALSNLRRTVRPHCGARRAGNSASDPVCR